MISPGVFFIFSKILIFWVVRGEGREGTEGGGESAKNGPKQKILCHTPYLMNYTSYDCHLWYKCVKW